MIKLIVALRHFAKALKNEFETCYICRILMKLEFIRQIFEKYSSIKIHDSSSSGSWVVPCCRTDRQRDMMKLVVALRNFGNAPKDEFEIRIVYIKTFRV